eukprot:SAG11_NODE_17_length_26125_cov_45.892723_19_plen_73_part_00
MGEQDPFFRMLTGAEHHHGECQLDFKFLGRNILTCRPGFGAFSPTPTCFSFYQVLLNFTRQNCVDGAARFYE